MKIIVKDTDEFLDILYGDKDSWGMNKKQVKTILKSHMESLERIYDYLDDTTFQGIEQYDLGDVMNLLQQFINNLKYDEKENK